MKYGLINGIRVDVRPKKVWTYAKGQVYIDLGDDFLFSITEWTDHSRGLGFRVSKKQFIIDNGGDESLLVIATIRSNN